MNVTTAKGLETVAELTYLIGRQGLLGADEGLRVPVQVVDIKRAYGRLRYQISPLHMGKPRAALGRVWVSADRVELEAAK